MIIGKSAARSSRRNVGARPKTMCRQTLRNDVPAAGKPALSCHPHRAPIVYSTLRYFTPPKSRIKHPRACGSSARRSPDASVSRCRTVVRPLQRMRLERDADDNRTALITPSNARFTDLGMLVSRLTFIQQRSYDRRCRTSHSCQKGTRPPDPQARSRISKLPEEARSPGQVRAHTRYLSCAALVMR